MRIYGEGTDGGDGKSGASRLVPQIGSLRLLAPKIVNGNVTRPAPPCRCVRTMRDEGNGIRAPSREGNVLAEWLNQTCFVGLLKMDTKRDSNKIKLWVKAKTFLCLFKYGSGEMFCVGRLAIDTPDHIVMSKLASRAKNIAKLRSLNWPPKAKWHAHCVRSAF